MRDADWLGISVITQLEFLSFPGLSTDDESLFRRFTERVEIVGLDAQAVDLISLTVQLRTARKLKLPDAIIAASAAIHRATLVTADQELLRGARHAPELAVLEFPVS